MRKRLASALVLALVLALPALAAAGPWAVVATSFTSPDEPPYYDDRTAIYTVDLGSKPPRYYGPFLQGLLGSAGGGVFDVAMHPNGREAIVSNFGDSKVFRVDISNPRAPMLTGELSIGFFAEDMDISPDGKWAVVADGGFSDKLAFIDMKTFTLKSAFTLEIPNPLDPLTPISVYANAVDIAPNGRDVLVADYFQGYIGFGKVNATRDGLTNLKRVYLCDMVDPADVDPSDGLDCIGNFGRPVNVTISPDGKTALAALASTVFDPGGVDTNVGAIAAFRITSGGNVVPGTPFFVTGITTPDELTPPGSVGGNQSIAFTPDGGAAFVLHQPIGEVVDPDPDPIPAPGDPPVMTGRLNEMAKVKILGPGKVALRKETVTTLGGRGTSQLFGVDTLAVGPNGWILGSNPTMSGFEPVLTAYNYLTKYKNTLIFPDHVIPVGVAFRK